MTYRRQTAESVKFGYVSGQYLNEEFFGAPRQYGIRLEKTF
jgi:hypothetical protein